MISFQNKIEQYINEIRELENNFLEVQCKEILPLSFFSSSIDILNSLRAGIYEIEAEQLQMMQQHLKDNDNKWNEGETEEPVELKTTDEKQVEKKSNLIASVLADKIGKKINADFGKSLSLNDRFMFQRDLFQGNTDEMNKAFAHLNTFQLLNEALEFLNEKYIIPWKSDSGITFKELLDKRFA